MNLNFFGTQKRKTIKELRKVKKSLINLNFFGTQKRKTIKE